jgi:hypothetical protein
MCLLLGVLASSYSANTTAAGPPDKDSWAELGPLNAGRFGCKAQAIDGHRAIVFAGDDDGPGRAAASAEILDTTTGQWTLAAPMPADFVPGANPWTAKLKDGYFVVAGGFMAAVSGSLRSYVYSVSRDAWIRTGDLPAGSTVGSNVGQTDAIVLDDGRVLAAGGLSFGFETTSVSVVFTPNYANLDSGLSGEAAGTWDFTRDAGGHITGLSGPAEHHKLIKLMDGRVLLVVGYDQAYLGEGGDVVFRDTPGVQAELFSPASGTWTPLPNLPAIAGEDDRHVGVKGIRQQATVALLNDGRVLVAGGFSEPTDDVGQPLIRYVRSSAILFDPHLFDQGAYPWSVTSPMHVARDTHAMGSLPGSHGVIAVWGETQDGVTPTAEIYDPARGDWRLVSGLPELQGTGLPVSLPPGCSAMMPGGKMIVMGGGFDLESQATSRRTYAYRP